jgi:lipopolysaccharide exporter
VSIIGAGRDQGLNLLLAAVGGPVLLGIWSAAFRLFLAIQLFLEALWRVAFPAMSRILEAGINPRSLIERGLRLNSVALSAVAVAVGGPAPALVNVVFGPPFASASHVLPWGAAALLVSGPLTTSVMGFLQARGDTSRLLQVNMVYTIIWLASAAALVPIVGVVGAGMSMFIAEVVLSILIYAWLRTQMTVPVLRIIAVPAAIAVVSGGAAWTVSTAVHPDLLGLVSGLLVGEVIYWTLMCVARRDDVVALVRILHGAVAAALRGNRMRSGLDGVEDHDSLAS